MKVRYLRDVRTPPHQVGKTGDEKDLAKDVAEHLLSRGYVEKADHKKKKGSQANGSIDQSTNPASQ